MYKEPAYATNFKKTENEVGEPIVIFPCCINPSKIVIYYDALICSILICIFFFLNED